MNQQNDKKEYRAAILTFFIILGFTLIWYGKDSIPPGFFMNLKEYDESTHNSCHVIVTEPSIVVRIDDIQDHNVPLKDMIIEGMRRNISLTLGVIPDRIGHEPEFDEFLRGISQNSRIEIAQHGTNHTPTDINITEQEMNKGFDRIIAELGVVPVTYIPPYNTMTPEAKEVVGKKFKIISLSGGAFKSGEQYAEISQDVETFDYEGLYSSHKGPSSVEDVIRDCRIAINKKNLCVVTFHPQELSTDIENAVDINASNYLHYMVLLDNLQKMNATFITLSNTTRCVE